MAVAQTVSELSGNLPPQNLDAEQSVLGCMMLQNDAIDEVADVIQARHFYSPKNQQIAGAIYSLYESTSGGVDAVTVAEELNKYNQLDEVGGPTYLHEILESVPHSAHAAYYARIVRDKFILRSLRDTCASILREVHEQGDEVSTVLTKAEQRIFEILELRGSVENLQIRDILLTTFSVINERWQNEGQLPGLSSGFADLDNMTSGLQPSDLVILAARPSMGKTAFVCNLALTVASNAKKEHDQIDRIEKLTSNVPENGVLFFSLEQSQLELSERFLCIHGKLDGHRLKRGELDADEKETVQVAASRLSELPIFIDDKPSRSMAEIGAICRRMKRRFGISLVIIDYLQLIEPEDRKAPREQQVAQIARRLKHLAKEIRVPVIALAQLNRGVELREIKRPRLADLRESGAIEQDADLVMFLHRPDAYDPQDRPGEAEVILAKHRNGPTGIITMTWLKESMRFVDHSQHIAEPDGGYQFDSDAVEAF